VGRYNGRGASRGDGPAQEDREVEDNTKVEGEEEKEGKSSFRGLIRESSPLRKGRRRSNKHGFGQNSTKTRSRVRESQKKTNEPRWNREQICHGAPGPSVRRPRGRRGKKKGNGKERGDGGGTGHWEESKKKDRPQKRRVRKTTRRTPEEQQCGGKTERILNRDNCAGGSGRRRKKARHTGVTCQRPDRTTTILEGGKSNEPGTCTQELIGKKPQKKVTARTTVGRREYH